MQETGAKDTAGRWSAGLGGWWPALPQGAGSAMAYVSPRLRLQLLVQSVWKWER